MGLLRLAFGFVLIYGFVGMNIHRRRIYLEDKAKVVASDWGTESLAH